MAPPFHTPPLHSSVHPRSRSYDLGARANIEMVLGTNPWLWLLPTPPDLEALESTRCGVSYRPEEHGELLEVLGRLGVSAHQLLQDMLPPGLRQLEGGGGAGGASGAAPGLPGAAGEDEEAALVVRGRA